jgi:cytochrome c biogenesis protein
MSSTAKRPSLQQSVALVWRTLRSMRTALVLLLLLALAAVTGSLIPQLPSSPARVALYQAQHPFWGQFYLRAGLFDVFGSWWFVLIVTLLFVSLVACLVPRTRATWRALRAKPIQARELDAFRHYVERPVAMAPEAAIEASRRTLRRRRFRVARAEAYPGLAAEKGAAREVGSLLFHWAFILLLLGVLLGKGTGYSGVIAIVDGRTWVDAQANYDGQITAGRFFDNRFTGIGIHLISFQGTYRSSGIPKDFVSHVVLLDPAGKPVRSTDIRVNHPAQFAGLNIYQSGFGWAPILRINEGHQVLANGPLRLQEEPAPSGIPAAAMPWFGFEKITSTDPAMAVEVELYPNGAAYYAQLRTGQPVPMLTEFDPIIRFTVWRGPILDPSLTNLDTTGLRKTASGFVGGARTVSLTTGAMLKPGAPPAANDLTMTFSALPHYSVLEITKDRGVLIVLAAAILILLGLLPALYTSRRKVWVRAEPHGEGAMLKVGGFALQRKPQFEDEFAKVVDAVVRASGGEPATPPSPDRETPTNEKPTNEKPTNEKVGSR